LKLLIEGKRREKKSIVIVKRNHRAQKKKREWRWAPNKWVTHISRWVSGKGLRRRREGGRGIKLVGTADRNRISF